MPDLAPIEQFLSTLSSQKGFSTNTLSAYRSDLSQFSDYLAAGRGASIAPVNDWASVTRDDIMSFVLHLKERGYVQTTVARKLAAIKSFYKYLVAEKKVSANPAEELASLHVDRSLPHTASTSEIDLLMASLNQAAETPEVLRDRAMFQVLYATGLRAGEMVAVSVSDLDRAAGTLEVPGGRGKTRRVAINSRLALQALDAYLERGRPLLARSGTHGANLAEEEKPSDALFLN